MSRTRISNNRNLGDEGDDPDGEATVVGGCLTYVALLRVAWNMFQKKMGWESGT